MYANESLKKYIDALAGRQPTPGGGSAAGLCGALGIALLEMVCNFTVRNEKYRTFESDIQKYLVSLRNIRGEFSILIDEDMRVYSAIRSAFRTKDKKNIDKALKDGYYICLKMCMLSKCGLDIAPDLTKKGNINLITDIGCGVELLNAAFNSSVYNCRINLKGIGDRAFVEKETAALDALAKEAEGLYDDATTKTQERMRE